MNKDHSQVYSERAAVIVAFARLALLQGWRAGVTAGQDANWPVVYVNLPSGEQVSWHIAPVDVHLLAGLPTYEGGWDGKFTGRNPEWCKLVPTP